MESETMQPVVKILKKVPSLAENHQVMACLASIEFVEAIKSNNLELAIQIIQSPPLSRGTNKSVTDESEMIFDLGKMIAIKEKQSVKIVT